MPRANIPAEQNALLGDTITSPMFLLELQLVQRTYRVSSFADSVTLLGVNWIDAQISVSGPTQKAGGMLMASITIPFDVAQNGGTIMQDVLQTRPQDRPAKLYQTYFKEQGYVTPILLLDGLIDEVQLGLGSQNTKPRMTFSITSLGNRGGMTPFVRLAAPLLKWLTPAGSILIWNNGRFEIDRR